ncbi:hypothetical protein AXF42_Ash016246 [Apostasia shenzhenica]|uniref:Uncharacterized protein n=1 Tax=Apostasia shenzhenica TaxID=1088818 RepID=A0A2H9ZX66_9ASPA|nr:hypothetical protein AXF42_Ash016246 [Apostasia shenzhenica]
MGESGGGPAIAPLNVERGDQERWRHFDNSVNAVSFGFVATAILISMFLVMAIFERFLRPRSSLFTSFTDNGRGGGDEGPSRSRGTSDVEAQHLDAARKFDFPSPMMSVYAKGVSVLMPGYDVPTFIAHPVPAPCPPEKISWPPHQQIPLGACSSSSS